jgi:hypothetical protein
MARKKRKAKVRPEAQRETRGLMHNVNRRDFGTRGSHDRLGPFRGPHELHFQQLRAVHCGPRL